MTFAERESIISPIMGQEITISNEARQKFEQAIADGVLGVEQDGTAWMKRTYPKTNVGEVEIRTPIDLETGELIEVVDLGVKLNTVALALIKEKVASLPKLG